MGWMGWMTGEWTGVGQTNTRGCALSPSRAGTLGKGRQAPGPAEEEWIISKIDLMLLEEKERETGRGGPREANADGQGMGETSDLEWKKKDNVQEMRLGMAWHGMAWHDSDRFEQRT
ncbi:hypothetical protein CSUB01_02151 [Colletotrichum sublineola]|uniref:Uncharacterized protein n=1 Tax=Colletotrichum sublineola TaxID=1173701 RepID=A0A066X449_COLSU|nr:hypothetical protein CSUB01_02151 [Colletotrichum sublineola]